MATLRMDYILCHGSGNRFVMTDATGEAVLRETADPVAFVRAVCAACATDGLLLLTETDGAPAMRMFNPDGSEAGMCGNGIRCVARLHAERTGACGRFEIRSGGRTYELTREEPLYGSIPTFGVLIQVDRASNDFPAARGESFLQEAIPDLDPQLRFTYLYLGNPHLVAFTERIDLDHLVRLGERISRLGTLFPHGMNLTLCRVEGPQHLFTATYERGAGLTPACGTAMTASSTAACLLGLCRRNEPIAVYNRGGMVRCLSRLDGERLATMLTGNATFEQRGRLHYEPLTSTVELYPSDDCLGERAEYARFLEAVARKTE